LVVLLALGMQVDSASSLGQQCYQCITRHPSWAVEKCTNKPVTCALGSFCTKAQFGGSLIVRGCAPGGTEKEFVKDSKMCKKTREYMASVHVAADVKKQFTAAVKVFEASCPPGNALKNLLKKKEPKLGFTCTKKLCNASNHLQAPSPAFFLTLTLAVVSAGKRLDF